MSTVRTSEKCPSYRGMRVISSVRVILTHLYLHLKHSARSSVRLYRLFLVRVAEAFLHMQTRSSIFVWQGWGGRETWHLTCHDPPRLPPQFLPPGKLLGAFSVQHCTSSTHANAYQHLGPCQLWGMYFICYPTLDPKPLLQTPWVRAHEDKCFSFQN